jgi:hypothetical protein
MELPEHLEITGHMTECELWGQGSPTTRQGHCNPVTTPLLRQEPELSDQLRTTPTDDRSAAKRPVRRIDVTRTLALVTLVDPPIEPPRADQRDDSTLHRGAQVDLVRR